MSLCINPTCQQATNRVDQGQNLFCTGCGSNLIVNDSYRVIRLLGSGGFGTTYLVNDAGTNKVLKVLHNTNPKAVELFEQEARVLKKLDHAGIPSVEADSPFMYIPNGGQLMHCLVMEFIEGEDLESYMQKRNFQPLAEKAAIRWLRELVEILDVVHGANYFHRDIKPPNIMIRNSGKLALIDFGTAREETQTYMQKQMGQGVTGIVSAGYTPHEQANGQAEPRSDFFSLGRTFVFLLTGKSPSVYPDSLKRGLQWQTDAQGYAKPLRDLIDELMRPDVNERSQNTHVILKKLDQLEADLYSSYSSNENETDQLSNKYGNVLSTIVVNPLDLIKRKHSSKQASLDGLSAIPPEVLGWNWGAFLLTVLWSIRNRVWFGIFYGIFHVVYWAISYDVGSFSSWGYSLWFEMILTLIFPITTFIYDFIYFLYYGLSSVSIISLIFLFLLMIWFGLKGNKWAWKNRSKSSIESFNNSQRIWCISGWILFLVLVAFNYFYYFYP